MGLKEATYFSVECDAEGCGTNTSELGDYSAWHDHGEALNEWTCAGGSYDAETGETLCSLHVPRCPVCDEPLDEDHLDEDHEGGSE